jgi:hypothetical protein
MTHAAAHCRLARDRLRRPLCPGAAPSRPLPCGAEVGAAATVQAVLPGNNGNNGARSDGDYRFQARIGLRWPGARSLSAPWRGELYRLRL